MPAKSALCGRRCQCSQRLLKTFDRNDLETIGFGPRSLGVSAGRHDEEIHICASRSDRLLLDASDGEHRSVESELACGGDPAAVRHVAP